MFLFYFISLRFSGELLRRADCERGETQPVENCFCFKMNFRNVCLAVSLLVLGYCSAWLRAETTTAATTSPYTPHTVIDLTDENFDELVRSEDQTEWIIFMLVFARLYHNGPFIYSMYSTAAT